MRWRKQLREIATDRWLYRTTTTTTTTSTTATTTATTTAATTTTTTTKTSFTEKIKKPQWFGASVAAVTSNAAHLPPMPFPSNLALVVAEHVAKARGKRKEALDAIRDATGNFIYNNTMASFHSSVAKEGTIKFHKGVMKMTQTLLRTCNMPVNTDLEMLHLIKNGKEKLLYALTHSSSSSVSSAPPFAPSSLLSSSLPSEFQNYFDTFIRDVCAPKMATLYDGENALNAELDTIYYQCFPCIRVIRPDEFSIGPHSDVCYGHLPCSVNFYIPLTSIGGTSSLYLESEPGLEDWHPIQGEAGDIHHFAGATNIHWTTENKTKKTRISFDVRLIAGPHFDLMKCGGGRDGGQLDVYRRDPGYYSVCRLKSGEWIREGPLLKPDARVGYPWTLSVKKWGKMLAKIHKDDNK